MLVLYQEVFVVVTVTKWVLRVSAILALILGIIIWANDSLANSLVNIHMPLGILVTLSLWVLGFMFGTAKGGKWGLASVAIVWGLLVLVVGASQIGMQPGPSLLIKIIHLLLGLIAIGIGEMVAGRYKRLNVARARAM
jgi:hypothetical protein